MASYLAAMKNAPFRPEVFVNLGSDYSDRAISDLPDYTGIQCRFCIRYRTALRTGTHIDE